VQEEEEEEEKALINSEHTHQLIIWPFYKYLTSFF
jgi:hypothetical protein